MTQCQIRYEENRMKQACITVTLGFFMSKNAADIVFYYVSVILDKKILILK